MTVFISQTAGIYGGLLSKKQENTIRCLQALQAQTISFYYYDDRQEPDPELQARLDGVLAGFSYGDDFILQMPAFLSLRYVSSLVDKLDVFRQNSSSKLIIYVHDDLLFDQQMVADSPLIDLLNRADVLIVNCPATERFLVATGVDKPHFCFFHLCDYLAPDYRPLPAINRGLSLLGKTAQLVPELTKTGETITSYEPAAGAGDGYRLSQLGLLDDDLTYQLAKTGGWGVVWPTLAREATCTSYDLGVFLSAGLPVIVKSGTPEARLVNRYQLGIIADSLSVGDNLRSLSIDDYLNYQENAQRLGSLTRTGSFTRQAVRAALEVGGRK